jgi:hypothetical protein
MNEEITIELDENYDRELPASPIRSVKHVKNNKDEEIVKRVDKTIDELIEQNVKDGKRAYWKSLTLNIIDKFIRFVSIGSTLVIGILGINLITNPDDTASAIAVTMLGFTATFTIQLNSEFNFHERSNVLRHCYYQYNEANDVLIKLKLSDDEPMKILEKAQKLKRKMNKIDITEFDSTIIDFDPGYRLSKPASIGIAETRNYINHRARDELNEQDDR